ncbi:sulfite exporter TauE/SafE family protein [Thermodesulfovibrio sp.]|uniref:sulfite exporter TauE/SafE family protein n=1 Tax=Thermodesulfovibrio sp. TaxID=2067987 RepID=UPI003C7DBC2A
MYIYLPVALTSINVFLPVCLGLAVGLLSGLFGVGGGWLMTPLLMMLGIQPAVAAATDAAQIVGASTSGTYAHWRLGNVDFKMGFHLLIGGFLGGLTGVEIIKILRVLGNVNFLIKITYVIMLGVIGTFMLIESLSKFKSKNKTVEKKEKKESVITKFFKSLPFQIHYKKSGVTHSILVTATVGYIVGILAAIMGVGGGFLMVPVMFYLLKMPMNIVIGTSLFQIFFTCVEVTFLQAYINHTVDILLAILLLIGSSFGAQIGAIIGKKIKGEQLRILMAILVLMVTVKIIIELITPPSILLSPAGGH